MRIVEEFYRHRFLLIHLSSQREDSLRVHYGCASPGGPGGPQSGAQPTGLPGSILTSFQLDDKDYYGNKRLELAGQLLGLLFEDLFKRLNAELRRAADAFFSRANRTGVFDVLKVSVASSGWWQARTDSFGGQCIRTDTITNGLEHALASGNWTVKRFRMDRKVRHKVSAVACLVVSCVT